MDVTSYGAPAPHRALVILSGVHGDEGFSSSALLCDAIGRWVADGTDGELASDAAVLMVHAVNPWGMSYWRRQNESNVDLNRNWGRDGWPAVPQNPGYDVIHPALVPGGERLPTPESLFEVTVKQGIDWARRQQLGEVIDVIPRYNPRWSYVLTRVPGLRELLTWNLVIVVRAR
jgi:hypothetical protein